MSMCHDINVYVSRYYLLTQTVFFKSVFGCQNDTLNCESLDMFLPCSEVK